MSGDVKFEGTQEEWDALVKKNNADALAKQLDSLSQPNEEKKGRKTPEEIWKECDEEFRKGSPNSEINRTCSNINDLIIYAMKLYANQSKWISVEEIERRRDLIISEPDGVVREQMIANLTI